MMAADEDDREKAIDKLGVGGLIEMIKQHPWDMMRDEGINRGLYSR